MIYVGDYNHMAANEDTVFYANYKIILPILLSILILLGLVATVFLIKKKSKSLAIVHSSNWFLPPGVPLISETINQNRILASSMSETPSIANIMSKQNAEPNYPAVRVQNNNLSFSSVDSVKFKMEGNGKRFIELFY